MSKQENESKSVGKVTDYAEERAVDESSVKLAVSSSSGQNEPEVKIVKLAAEDVALVMAELEFTKEATEELLRKHGGSAEAALRAYAAGK